MASDQTRRFARILVTRLRFIGDIILTIPVVQSLREAYPEAFIAYMGEREAVSLLSLNPYLDELIPFDASRPGFMEQTRIARELRKRKFDLVVDLFSNPRTALLTYLTGAPTRVGLDRKGRGRLYTVRVRDDGRPKSAVEFHQQFVTALGLTPSRELPSITLSEEERERARYRVQRLVPGRISPGSGRPLVGIHPGATWPAKRWFPEKFAALVDMVQSGLGGDVIVTGGPKDSATVRDVVRLARAEPAVTGPLSLRELAAVLGECSVFVTNDAGPMHISAAVGTPTVGLFGPGQEDIWFPYAAESGHIALRRDVPCHPCHLDVCDRPGEEHMRCMGLLGADEVFAAVGRALQAGPVGKSR
ncbi:MAG: glycosyltransferase family 9 protein [Bacteroidota bacterium]